MEFGYYQVHPTDAGRNFLPKAHHFAQWHWHTFDVPDGGVHLAESDLFPNQAFSVGDRIIGLQFHAEVTIEAFRRWQNRATRDIWDRHGVQARAQQSEAMYAHDAAQAAWFYGLLDHMFGARP